MGEEHEEDRVEAALAITHPESSPSPLGELYRQHARGAFLTAYRITGSVEDAEDALQTVFLRLARSGGATLADAIAGAYLRRAATNAALDVVRARRRAGEPLDAAADSFDSHPDAAPDRRLAASELADHLRRALAEIGGRGAEVFALRFIEGLDNREIAAQLETSAGSIAVTLHRTRARLLTMLAPYLGGIQ